MAVTTAQLPLRVLLVDDRELSRSGLRSLLAAEGFDVAEAGSVAEAIRALGEVTADVVLIGVGLASPSGAHAVGLLARAAPAAAVLMLGAADDDDRKLAEAVCAGARGSLRRNGDPSQLAFGIRAAAGASVVALGVTEALLRELHTLFRRADPVTPPVVLSERERMVLGLLVAGYSNAAIAERLFVSPSTVKSQVSSILDKLGVRNRVEAAVYAVRQGLVDDARP